MAPHDAYRAQVELLIRCLPAVANAPDFALKGGTAINLFSALTDIRVQLATIGEALRRTVPGVNVQLVPGEAPKLLVDKSGARVKVEPSVVMRGRLVPPVGSELCAAAQEAYELYVEIRCLDGADLYGGKLCAALDRQHPRDLFDIMHLQAVGPIPDLTRQAFVAYLAGHRRPIAELLAPNRKSIDDLFANHFAGMSKQPIELDELEAARTHLFQWAATALTESERRFLLSIKQGEPDWTLLPFEGLDRWPAIQWKLHNVRQMSARAHKAALSRLRVVLEI